MSLAVTGRSTGSKKSHTDIVVASGIDIQLQSVLSALPIEQVVVGKMVLQWPHRKVSSHAMLLNLLVSDVTKRPTSAAVEQHDKAH